MDTFGVHFDIQYVLLEHIRNVLMVLPQIQVLSHSTMS